MIVTLVEMKAYLGIVSGSDYDAFLTQQLTVVSDSIEAYCKRHFNKHTYTQTFPKEMTPSCQLEVDLAEYPIASITSITEGINDPMDPSQYILNKKYGSVFRRCFPFFLCREDTVFVYVAGYDQADIPSPLKQAVYSLVQESYNRKLAGVDLNFGSNVSSINLPGVLAINFDYSLQDKDRDAGFGKILGDWQNVIDGYRSERAVVGVVTREYLESV